jgi:hypothetical protein
MTVRGSFREATMPRGKPYHAKKVKTEEKKAPPKGKAKKGMKPPAAYGGRKIAV